jgi:hypothetical protein
MVTEMTRTHLQFMVCVLFLSVLSANGQEITGTTTEDIDPSTNVVTVVCETDLDMDSEAYYEAQVGCTLVDGNGTLLASGNSVDDSDEGFAQVVLTYQGTPGTIYNATGTHSGVIIFATDNVDEGWEGGGENQGFEGAGFDDVYNFAAITEFIDMGYGTMPFDFSYFGPGPDTETKKKTLPVIHTTDTGSIPATGGTLAVNFTGVIDSDDGMSATYALDVGSTSLGPILGPFLNGSQRCQIGNEEIGTLTSASQQVSYTVKRTLLGQTCWAGTNGDTLIGCLGTVSPGADDTGTWIETSPVNSKVFNLDIPGLPSLAQSNDITRSRLQFAITVVDSNGKPISPTVKYYSVISCKFPSGQPPVTLSTDVVGDNQGAIGKTQLSWNLK